MKRLSFTLIEIMVVIAILGVLATIVIIGSRRAILFARDSVRKTTLSALERAIAQYAVEEGEDHYPLSNENATLELLETSSPTGIKLLSGNYLKTIPLNLNSTDPDNRFYSYLTTPGADKFFLGVPLEGKERTYFAYQPNGTKERVSSNDLPIFHSSQSGLAVTQEGSGAITVFFNSATLPQLSGNLSPVIYRIFYQLGSGEWQKSAYSGNTAITLNNLASGT